MTGTSEVVIINVVQSGDAVGIDWGYFYVATADPNATFSLNQADTCRQTFSTSGYVKKGGKKEKKRG